MIRFRKNIPQNDPPRSLNATRSGSILGHSSHIGIDCKHIGIDCLCPKIRGPRAVDSYMLCGDIHIVFDWALTARRFPSHNGKDFLRGSFKDLSKDRSKAFNSKRLQVCNYLQHCSFTYCLVTNYAREIASLFSPCGPDRASRRPGPSRISFKGELSLSQNRPLPSGRVSSSVQDGHLPLSEAPHV